LGFTLFLAVLVRFYPVFTGYLCDTCAKSAYMLPKASKGRHCPIGQGASVFKPISKARGLHALFSFSNRQI
jgi:hypothetical protein